MVYIYIFISSVISRKIISLFSMTCFLFCAVCCIIRFADFHEKQASLRINLAELNSLGRKTVLVLQMDKLYHRKSEVSRQGNADGNVALKSCLIVFHLTHSFQI